MAYCDEWVIRRSLSQPILRYFSEFKVRSYWCKGYSQKRKIERDIIAVALTCQIIAYLKLTWVP